MQTWNRVFFVYFIDFSCLPHAKAWKEVKKINKTKIVPFHIHSGNELFKLVMVGNNLPWTICQ